MDASSVLRDRAGSVEVDIMVSPKAGRSGIEGIDEWRNRLVIKVRAPPTDGKANREICDLLGSVFGAKVELVRGATSRHKTVLVPLPYDQALRILEGAL